jgi:hypothetical protein
VLRLIGMILLGFGGVGFLILGIVAFGALDRMEPMEIGVGICFSVIPMASVAGGFALLWRTEPEENTYGIPEDPTNMQDLLDEANYRSFSLWRLNGIGWLLLCGATVVIVGQIVLFLVFREEIGWQDQSNTVRRWFARALFTVPLFFMVGVRWTLGWFGISIYRR